MRVLFTRPCVFIAFLTLATANHGLHAQEISRETEQTLICSETPLQEKTNSEIDKVCVGTTYSAYSSHPTYFAFVRYQREVVETKNFPLHLTSLGIELLSSTDEKNRVVFSMHAYTVIGSKVGWLQLVYESKEDQAVGRFPSRIEGTTPLGESFSLTDVYQGYP